MPTRTITAAEDSLTRRLVHLGVGSARPTIREALRIGYSPEAVGAILEWFAGQARTDAKGQVWFPYSPSQLVWRLRDDDGREARPEQGNWKGGKCGIWLALESKDEPSAVSRQPSASQILDRLPEEIARSLAKIEAREACYGAQVDALTVPECKQLLTGNAMYLACLSRWSGSGPKPMSLRVTLKLALEQQESACGVPRTPQGGHP